MNSLRKAHFKIWKKRITYKLDDGKSTLNAHSVAFKWWKLVDHEKL